MSEDITVFDYIKQIDNKTNKIPFDQKKCSAYILALHYSHDNNLLNIINNINSQLYNINSAYVYRYFFEKIPKSKKYIKWIKKDKKKENDALELMKKYNISYREALESLI